MIFAACAAVVGASSRKLRARSQRDLWMSSSDIVRRVDAHALQALARVATSSFGDQRLVAVLDHARSSTTIEVPIWPGITTEHLMCGALRRRSLISASVNPFTANFAAL